MDERIESSWDRVWEGDASLPASSRVVRAVVCDSSKPHDEILYPKRRRHFNFGRWYPEKKAETLTNSSKPSLRTMNDSTLVDRVSSPLLTIEEMTELRSPFAQVPLR